MNKLMNKMLAVLVCSPHELALTAFLEKMKGPTIRTCTILRSGKRTLSGASIESEMAVDGELGCKSYKSLSQTTSVKQDYWEQDM